MLRKIRIAAAWCGVVIAAVLVLDFTGATHAWLGWVARVQLFPAILAVNVTAIIVVAVLTLLFGRIYCSVLCPLGVMQDGIGWFTARKRKHKFARGSLLRWVVLAAALCAIIFGMAWVVVLVDPWGIFGRIAQNIASPVWRVGNNALAWLAERVDSYAFYSVDVHVKSWLAFGLAALCLVGLAVLAWWRGRWYCNSICPVGSFLGLVSRVAVFRPRFDAQKCTRCGVCEKNCKGECIDSKKMEIDSSRCVVCFDCVDSCKFRAMKYGACQEKPATEKGVSRRKFLAIAGAVAAAPLAARAQQLQVDGGLADIADKKRPERKNPIIPPGAGDARNLKRHCTACQLCVAACPNDVLVPSSRLETLMQPEMTFERGYCRPECVECGAVCPTGAIEKITAAQKSAIALGTAHYYKEVCVVTTDEVKCTVCEKHCPTGAITLVDKMPLVSPEKCIGCGACEHLCPARPLAAIRVEGNLTHHEL